MMVGPIMMIQPSKGQRALTALREKAQMSGLKIRMVPNTQTKGAQFLAMYLQPLDIPKKATQPVKVMIERKNYSHGLHFDKEWALSTPTTFTPALEKTLKDLVQRLPHTVMGISIQHAEVGILWTERQRKGTNINDDLTLLSQALNELKVAVEQGITRQ